MKEYYTVYRCYSRSEKQRGKVHSSHTRACRATDCGLDVDENFYIKTVPNRTLNAEFDCPKCKKLQAVEAQCQ